MHFVRELLTTRMLPSTFYKRKHRNPSVSLGFDRFTPLGGV